MRISSVGIEEYVQLLANWEYSTNEKQYNCSTKMLKYNGEQLEDFKNVNGCGFRITEEPRRTIDNINFHSCVCDHLHPDMNHLLFLHSKYEEGVLPFEGSLSDQPNHIIEIFHILDRKKMEWKEKNRKEQEAQMKKERSKNVRR